GGPGTDVFDKVAALDQWVESGVKPQSIPAAHMTGTLADRTRPLCAYPASARYIGSTSTDDARNSLCQPPSTPGAARYFSRALTAPPSLSACDPSPCARPV